MTRNVLMHVTDDGYIDTTCQDCAQPIRRGDDALHVSDLDDALASHTCAPHDVAEVGAADEADERRER